MIRRFLLLLAIAGPSSLPAATFIVDSTGSDGAQGTLRWALEQHAATGGSNQILFDAALSGQTIQFVPGGLLPPINAGPLTIDGSGAPGVAIDATGQGRILLINNNAFVTIRNLKLQNSDGLFGGGCIRSVGFRPVIVVERVVFENCQQRTTSTQDAFGGAVYVEFDGSGTGSLSVRDSRFVGNRVYGTTNIIFGGAIYVQGQSVTLARNVFELNSADNTASAFAQGGAVFVQNADAEIYDNEFLFNQAADSAGGALVLNLQSANNAFVVGNLFAGNVASVGGAVWTGTQVVDGSPFFNFTHNTLLANTSDSNVGGAMFLREGRVILRNNTFAENTNLAGGAAHLGYNPGATAFLSIWNNLFGAASTPWCATAGGVTSPYPSVGHNVFPDASCSITGLNNIIDDAGRFLALGNYGGRTRSLPPASGNLALDNGNPAPWSDGNAATCPEFDVRGQLRPGDGNADGIAACDVGAFEWPAEAALFLDGFEASGLVLP